MAAAISLAFRPAAAVLDGSRWLDWGNVAGLVIALALLGVTATGHMPRAVRERLPALLVIVSAPAFLLILGSGGLRSPGVALAGLLVMGIAAGRGRLTGVSVVLLAFGALLAGDIALHRDVALSEVLEAGVVLAAVGLGPIWYGQLVRRDIEADRRHIQLVQGFVAGNRATPRGTRAIVSDLRRDSIRVREEAEAMVHLGIIRRFLRDVHDVLGADEVIFWRLSEANEEISASVWSTDGPEIPLHFTEEDGIPLVQWAARQRMVLTNDGTKSAHTMIAGPVDADSQLHGAMSVVAAAGFAVPLDDAKDLVRRFGSHLGTVLGLLEVRRSAGRRAAHSRALMKAVARIQDSLDPAALGAAICETALEVTSASRSAFVHWDGATTTGYVRSVSAKHSIAPKLTLSADSLVARSCRDAQPLIFEDAERVMQRNDVFTSVEPRRAIGSLGIVPLSRDHSVIGAIVVEGESPNQIATQEVDNISLLGSVVALSIRTSFEFTKQSELARTQTELAEQQTALARTDPLTGLANRRTFDERLAGLLAESDRYSTSVSLILADIDFFKRVNDAFGHDAGDAVLRHFACSVAKGLRAEIDLCARYGGEEIAILLPQTDVAGARDVAERLRRSVESQAVPFDDRSILVTASFGVASYPSSATNRDGLFPAADRALYQAKSGGRNRVICSASNASPFST